MKDFRATGRMGCARCYTTFEPSMRELLRRVHGSPRHTGRAYRPPKDEVLERASVLGELRERLRRAIEQEQFEVAAELRDRIRVLE
jgi:protein arginine kinase activator